MSTGTGGANVNNSGGEEIVTREVIETTTEGKRVYEGLEGQEALTRVELNSGDTKHFWGNKGAERMNRIVKANGVIEAYKGTTGREYCTSRTWPSHSTTLYGGSCKSTYRSHALWIEEREMRFYQRTGAPEDQTSEWLLKVDQFGHVFWRGSELDYWEEVHIPKEAIKARARFRKEEEERERANKRAREAREEEARAVAQRRGEANALHNHGFNAGGEGGVQGEDKAQFKNVDVMDPNQLDQSHC